MNVGRSSAAAPIAAGRNVPWARCPSPAARGFLPATRRDETLVVHVGGLGESGIGRLGSFLFRGAGRTAVLAGHRWNVVAGTAGDGLLLRVPRWADYPDKSAFDSHWATVSFERGSGFFSGLGGSSPITLEFSALPLHASGTLPAAEG